MLLTCPACDTQYKVDEAALDPEGSKVRCFRCSYTWVAKPSGRPAVVPDEPQASIELEEAEIREAPESVEQTGGAKDEPEAPAASEEPRVSAPDAPTTPSKAEPKPVSKAEFKPTPKPAPKPNAEPLDREQLAALRSKREMPVWPFYALILLLLGALVVLLYTGREQMSRVHPLATEAYRAFGYEVVLPGDGLSIESIKSVQRVNASGGELEVVGEVVNVSDRPRLVPGLRLIVLGANGEELTSWTERLNEKALMPKERALFSFSLDSPPQGAANVEIEFVALPAE